MFKTYRLHFLCHNSVTTFQWTRVWRVWRATPGAGRWRGRGAGPWSPRGLARAASCWPARSGAAPSTTRTSPPGHQVGRGLWGKYLKVSKQMNEWVERQMQDMMMLHFIDGKTNGLDFKRSNKGNHWYMLNIYSVWFSIIWITQIFDARLEESNLVIYLSHKTYPMNVF